MTAKARKPRKKPISSGKSTTNTNSVADAVVENKTDAPPPPTDDKKAPEEAAPEEVAAVNAEGVCEPPAEPAGEPEPSAVDEGNA